ncbi:hypothetical protein MBLNU13_g06060t1 [Cladosporium sp. NU13]
MSGAEAIVVLGLISSIIAIIETSKKLYDASHDGKGLHEAFRDVAQNMPLVLDILRDCQAIQQQVAKDCETTTDAAHKQELEESSEATKTVMAGCHKKAETLESIFKKVMPAEGDKRRERYKKAATASMKPGRAKKVVDLMAGIMTNLQTLQTSRFFKDQLEKRGVDIKAALDKLSELRPSLSDGQGTFNHSGSGPQNILTGKGSQYNFSQSGKKNKMFNGHKQYFGRVDKSDTDSSSEEDEDEDENED